MPSHATVKATPLELGGGGGWLTIANPCDVGEHVIKYYYLFQKTTNKVRVKTGLTYMYNYANNADYDA